MMINLKNIIIIIIIIDDDDDCAKSFKQAEFCFSDCIVSFRLFFNCSYCCYESFECVFYNKFCNSAYYLQVQSRIHIGVSIHIRVSIFINVICNKRFSNVNMVTDHKRFAYANIIADHHHKIVFWGNVSSNKCFNESLFLQNFKCSFDTCHHHRHGCRHRHHVVVVYPRMSLAMDPSCHL